MVFANESFVSLQHIGIKHLLNTTSILTCWSSLWPLLAEDKVWEERKLIMILLMGSED